MEGSMVWGQASDLFGSSNFTTYVCGWSRAARPPFSPYQYRCAKLPALHPFPGMSLAIFQDSAQSFIHCILSANKPDLSVFMAMLSIHIYVFSLSVFIELSVLLTGFLIVPEWTVIFLDKVCSLLVLAWRQAQSVCQTNECCYNQ